jgi:hypothetical protein
MEQNGVHFAFKTGGSSGQLKEVRRLRRYMQLCRGFRKSWWGGGKHRTYCYSCPSFQVGFTRAPEIQTSSTTWEQFRPGGPE